MDENIFSSSLTLENDGDLNQNIQSALSEIRGAFEDQEIKVLRWNENYVAIPLILKINLPTRGTVHEVDIRKDEPIVIILDRRYYPYKAPQAWSDRRDFPKDCLPHLNPKPPGNPASFCLHRGSIETWFSEHSIIDFIQRVQFWLSDAASDRLIRKEDGFEVTRIDDFIGLCTYDPNKFRERVAEGWQSNRNRSGFCFVPYILEKNLEKEPFENKNTFFMIKMGTRLTESVPNKIIQLEKEINALHTDTNLSDCNLYGILVWPPKKMIYRKYFADLPDNLRGLIALSEKIEIPIKMAMNSFFSKNLHLLSGVPITLVIPRPQNVLKSESNLELVNFMVYCEKRMKSLEDEKSLESNVKPMIQRSPLTLQLAKNISHLPPDFDTGEILFLGCGAVGSKLALHIMKSGQTKKITFVDDDLLTSHNLVRHGLLAESLGMNKAQAMKDVVEKVYSSDKDSISVGAIKDNIINLFFGKNHEIFCQHKWLIDATASTTVRNLLLQENLPQSLSICRCEIAYNGKLGFLSIEGPDRNPRLDDLLFSIFDLAINHQEISDWLVSTKNQREADPETTLEEISIGMSCSSETMRIADDSISFHASMFSLGFRKIAPKKPVSDNGFLQVSTNNMDHESNCCTKSYDIAPVSIIRGENNTNWQFRIKSEASKHLIQCFHKSGRNETGGLLIGQFDIKKKVVYITRILTAPTDSKCRPYGFVRGVMNVPEEVSKMSLLSGGMIDYVGEWHTHPVGGKRLSAIDEDAVSKIKKVLDPVSRPTLVMIVTKDGLHPYIFEPGS